MPGAGLLGNDGPGGAEPPGLLGSGGGGARPGLGDGGRLQEQNRSLCKKLYAKHIVIFKAYENAGFETFFF